MAVCKYADTTLLTTTPLASSAPPGLDDVRFRSQQGVHRRERSQVPLWNDSAVHPEQPIVDDFWDRYSGVPTQFARFDMLGYVEAIDVGEPFEQDSCVLRDQYRSYRSMSPRPSAAIPAETNRAPFCDGAGGVPDRAQRYLGRTQCCPERVPSDSICGATMRTAPQSGNEATMCATARFQPRNRCFRALQWLHTCVAAVIQ